MRRAFCYGLLGAAGLSLLAGLTQPNVLPTVFSEPKQTVALAQNDRTEMTLSRLEAILQEEGSNIRGSGGQWQLTVDDRDLIVLADATNDRMRIVSPVVAASEISAQQVQNMLLANFHSALDARYAVSDGTVVSVFVHPLGSLDEGYLRSALSQVASLADTFGTTYSSGDLGFGSSGGGAASSGDRLEI